MDHARTDALVRALVQGELDDPAVTREWSALLDVAGPYRHHDIAPSGPPKRGAPRHCLARVDVERGSFLLEARENDEKRVNALRIAPQGAGWYGTWEWPSSQDASMVRDERPGGDARSVVWLSESERPTCAAVLIGEPYRMPPEPARASKLWGPPPEEPEPMSSSEELARLLASLGVRVAFVEYREDVGAAALADVARHALDSLASDAAHGRLEPCAIGYGRGATCAAGLGLHDLVLVAPSGDDVVSAIASSSRVVMLDAGRAPASNALLVKLPGVAPHAISKSYPRLTASLAELAFGTREMFGDLPVGRLIGEDVARAARKEPLREESDELAYSLVRKLRPIPATIDEAVEDLSRTVPRERLEEWAALSEDDAMGSAHFGLGMGMRNRWGLWSRNQLTAHMQERDIHHPDSMSSEILRALHAKCRRR